MEEGWSLHERGTLLRVQQLGEIAGTVLATNGTPAGAFEVQYTDEAGATGIYSGSGGHWSVPSLRPGLYV